MRSPAITLLLSALLAQAASCSAKNAVSARATRDVAGPKKSPAQPSPSQPGDGQAPGPGNPEGQGGGGVVLAPTPTPEPTPSFSLSLASPVLSSQCVISSDLGVSGSGAALDGTFSLAPALGMGSGAVSVDSVAGVPQRILLGGLAHSDSAQSFSIELSGAKTGAHVAPITRTFALAPTGTPFPAMPGEALLASEHPAGVLQGGGQVWSPLKGTGAGCALCARPALSGMISVGARSSCAIGADERIWCAGELHENSGVAAREAESDTFQAMPTLEKVSFIANGSMGNQDEITCAIKQSDGGLMCWGKNSHSGLGLGASDTTDRYVAPAEPVFPPAALPLRKVRIGGRNNCALGANQRVYCWGYNQGSLMSGSSNVAGTAVIANGARSAVVVIRQSDGDGDPLNNPEWGGVLDFSLNGDGTFTSACGIVRNASNTANEVRCWGYERFGIQGNSNTSTKAYPQGAIAGLTDPYAIEMGSYTGCAIDRNGAARGIVKCWGQGAYSLNGSVSRTNTTSAMIIAGLDGTSADNTALSISIHTAGMHACALTASQKVKCWGANRYGELGTLRADRLSGSNPTAEAVPGVTALAVAAGESTTCILTPEKEVKCWGRDMNAGAMGRDAGSQNIFGFAFGLSHPDGTFLTDVQSVAKMDLGVCARLGSGEVKCTGGATGIEAGEQGLFMNSAQPSGSGTPVSNVVQVVASDSSMCVLRSAGNVHCWGSGEVVENIHPEDRSGANSIGSTSDGAELAAGSDHVCLRQAVSKKVICWGSNAAGQLGDGTTTNRSTPVTVKYDSDPGAGVTLADLENIVAIWAGGSNTCVKQDDTVTIKFFCWGSNTGGQLTLDGTVGTPVTHAIEMTAEDSGTHALVPGGASVSNRDNMGTLCALRGASRQVHCWGYASKAYFTSEGAYFTDRVIQPKTASDTAPLSTANGVPVQNVARIATSTGPLACVLTNAGAIHCWGRDSEGAFATGNAMNATWFRYAQTAVLPTGWVADDVAVHSGAFSTDPSICAVLRNTGTNEKRVACVGSNQLGALGSASSLVFPLSGTPSADAVLQPRAARKFEASTVSILDAFVSVCRAFGLVP